MNEQVGEIIKLIKQSELYYMCSKHLDSDFVNVELDLLEEKILQSLSVTNNKDMLKKAYNDSRFYNLMSFEDWYEIKQTC